MSGAANLAPAAVAKTSFLDVVAVLTAHGVAAGDIPAKLEGLSFGRDVVIDGARRHTLWLSNDNDFLGTIIDAHHPAGIDNPNQFFVFAVDPELLLGFEPRAGGRDDGDEESSATNSSGSVVLASRSCSMVTSAP